MRWSTAAIPGGDRPIPPENGAAHPRISEPAQATGSETETGANCRQEAVPARKKSRTPADSRQPSLPGLSPVATPELKPAGAGKWLRDLDTHSGEIGTYRRCVAGELQRRSRFPCSFGGRGAGSRSLSLPPLPSSSSRWSPSLPAFNFSLASGGARSMGFEASSKLLGWRRRGREVLPNSISLKSNVTPSPLLKLVLIYFPPLKSWTLFILPPWRKDFYLFPPLDL